VKKNRSILSQRINKKQVMNVTLCRFFFNLDRIDLWTMKTLLLTVFALFVKDSLFVMANSTQKVSWKTHLNFRKIITLLISTFYLFIFFILHSCSGPLWHSRNSRHTRPSRSRWCKGRTRRVWSQGRAGFQGRGWCQGFFKLETVCLERGWRPRFWFN